MKSIDTNRAAHAVFRDCVLLTSVWALVSFGCKEIPPGDMYPSEAKARAILTELGIVMQRVEKDGGDLLSMHAPNDVVEFAVTHGLYSRERPQSEFKQDPWGRAYRWEVRKKDGETTILVWSIGKNVGNRDDDVVLKYSVGVTGSGKYEVNSQHF